RAQHNSVMSGSMIYQCRKLSVIANALFHLISAMNRRLHHCTRLPTTDRAARHPEQATGSSRQPARIQGHYPQLWSIAVQGCTVHNRGLVVGTRDSVNIMAYEQECIR